MSRRNSRFGGQVEATIFVMRGEGDDEVEIEVTVKGIMTPYIPAKIYGPPENCYPEEGGELDDVKYLVDDKPFELTSSEEEDARDALLSAEPDDYYDDYEPDYEPDDYYDDLDFDPNYDVSSYNKDI